MRALTSSSGAAFSARVTRPGYLIEILANPELRLTTRSDCEWAGFSWIGQDVSVAGVGGAGNSASSPKLTFADADGLVAAMVLQDALDDVAVRIWVMDGAALGADDPVLVFSGSIAAQQINPGKGVTLTCGIGRAKALFSPRVFYGAALGMTRMVPAGTVLQIGNVRYNVERR